MIEGSGSVPLINGSVRPKNIRIRRIHILNTGKIGRRALIPIFCDFFTKNHVNVPSKSNKLTKMAGSWAGSGSISQRDGSADSDPYKNATDPQQCLIGVPWIQVVIELDSNRKHPPPPPNQPVYWYQRVPNLWFLPLIWTSYLEGGKDPPHALPGTLRTRPGTYKQEF
jgi:hypothetical protein